MCMCIFLACMHESHVEARKGHWISWNWSYKLELPLSGPVDSDIISRAMSPISNKAYLKSTALALGMKPQDLCMLRKYSATKKNIQPESKKLYH